MFRFSKRVARSGSSPSRPLWYRPILERLEDRTVLSNIIVNGDFEAGNTGFTTQYNYSPGDIGPAQSYDVVDNPAHSRPHDINPVSYGDHTTGSGLMLAVNGAAQANVTVWGQSLTVTPHTDYAFSLWMSSWFAASFATFDITFNGVSIGTPTAPSTTAVWQQFGTTWNSGTTTALTIGITDTNTDPDGNDFALDDISLTSLGATASHLVVSGTTPVVAGTPSSLTVTAYDASGHVATGYRGTVHFTSTDTNLQTILPPDYTFNDSDAGAHTFTNQLTLTKAGSQKVTATDEADGTITGRAAIIVLPAGAATLAVAAPSPVTAGGAFSATVTAKDPYGNVATGYRGTVHFSSTDNRPLTTLPADYTFNGTDAGKHTFTNGVTLTKAGNQTLRATDTATSTITGAKGTFVRAAAAAHFTITAPSTVTAGTPFNVTVTARDAYANVASSYRGTIHINLLYPDPAAALPADYPFTATDAGKHTFINGAMLLATDVQTIAVADTNDGSINGQVTVMVKAPTTGPVLYVDPSGHTPGGHTAYTTIQAAVNAAAAGTTIIVDPATYTENVTITQQRITVRGAEAGVNPVPGRSGPESVLNGTITITGARVTVDGFTVNATAQWAIEVGGASTPSAAATNCVIENNIVSSTVYGIQIGAEGGPGTTQVALYAVVRNNLVQTGNSAIVLFNTAGNTVQGNSILQSNYSGIDIYYSDNDSITDNLVSNCALTAIRLRGAHGNLVEYNDGTGDGQPPIQEGEGSSGNTILHNFGS
jgi:parallel beta-helix repeat protein